MTSAIHDPSIGFSRLEGQPFRQLRDFAGRGRCDRARQRHLEALLLLLDGAGDPATQFERERLRTAALECRLAAGDRGREVAVLRRALLLTVDLLAALL